MLFNAFGTGHYHRGDTLMSVPWDGIRRRWYVPNSTNNRNVSHVEETEFRPHPESVNCDPGIEFVGYDDVERENRLKEKLRPISPLYLSNR